MVQSINFVCNDTVVLFNIAGCSYHRIRKDIFTVSINCCVNQMFFIFF